jgi:beta-lactam-binding protein with PASTA domain
LCSARSVTSARSANRNVPDMPIEAALARSAGGLIAAAMIASLLAGGSSRDETVVPAVVGEAVTSAYEELQVAGFAIATEEPIRIDFTGAPVVDHQSVAGGSSAPRGGVIVLKLGQTERIGPGLPPWNTSTVQMPTVVGMALPDAIGALWSLGLSSTLAPLPALQATTEPTLLHNYVVSRQRPKPGTPFTATGVRETAYGVSSRTTTVGLVAKLRQRPSST